MHLVQTGGSALLDILTGAISPAGRLPNTWPASLDQVLNFNTCDIPLTVECTKVPEITNYTMVNRTYRYFEGVPLFPFGYGLYVINKKKK